jgi:hypothetical protein
MNIIFTDIDGVLFNTTSRSWNKTAVNLYNKLCNKYDLRAVVSSTWRVKHSMNDLQNVFYQNGIDVEIIDYTPIISFDGRGSEIEEWLRANEVDNFIILDDCTRDIERCGLANIVKCRGWIGFSQEEYNIAEEILNLKINYDK